MVDTAKFAKRIWEELDAHTSLQPGRGKYPDLIVDHVNRAIEFYRDENFFQYRKGAKIPITPLASYITYSNYLDSIDTVTIVDHRVKLRKYDIEDYYSLSPGDAGIPNIWSVRNERLYYHPRPNALMTLIATGWKAYEIANLPASLENLIAARTRHTLYRDFLTDVEGTKLSGIAMTEEMDRIYRGSAKKMKTPLRIVDNIPQGRSRRHGFDIRTG